MSSIPIPSTRTHARSDTSLEATLVRLQGVHVTLGTRTALRSVDLDVQAGELIAVCGANGAGKTTLLRVLAGLTRPHRGSVRLSPQGSIGYIGHQSMLYPDLTLAENLSLHARLSGYADAEARVREVIDELSLADRMDERVRSFSRGLLQRAACARAILNRPSLLLADEPLSGLDQPSAAIVRHCLLRTRARGAAIVWSDHDVHAAVHTATRLVVLRQGELVLNARTPDLSEDRVRAALGGVA